MPCDFAGTRSERASWDCSVELDLAMCEGVEFDFYCADPSPVGHFTMYFRSGKGWYSGSFSPSVVGEWGKIRVYRNATSIEGEPAGWGEVDTIRISAWRGKNVDTEFYLGNLSLFGDDAKIVVVRAESVAKSRPDEVTSVGRFTEMMGGMLEEAGLSCFTLSDLDITPGRLKNIGLIVLPHNPSVPEETLEVIAGFIERGGKIITCYNLPNALQDVVGIRNEAFFRQGRAGEFASIRASDAPLKGAPAVVVQGSWNIRNALPVAGVSRVAAWWYDDAGKSTGKAAIVISERGAHLTHVLLDDDRANKVQLLLAMVGNLCPELWRDAAKGRIDAIGEFGPYDDYNTAYRDILKISGTSEETITALNTASRFGVSASDKLGAEDYSGAIVAAGQAREALIEAYCVAQKPLAGEHRAFWCHSAFGVDGVTWDEAIKRLADNGFTAILPNMLWAGVTYYPSDVLPVSPSVAERGDQIELCLAACKKYGVECHVWKVNHNMGWAADKKFMAKMSEAGRTQVSFDGTANERWLCPSHPENRKLEVESMVEVVRKYDVDGIHFDYIRYPGRDNCFCVGCRGRFEKVIGRKVGNWPADVRRDDELGDKWLGFRRKQITDTVAAVWAGAKKVRPEVKISAAVFRNWPSDRDSVGQDWKLWCEKGYLDFVCPMDYTPLNSLFDRMVTQQLEWTHGVPCYPGIGVSVWNDRTDIAKLIEQINITRKHKTGGFTIFNYATVEANHILPKLGKGITKK